MPKTKRKPQKFHEIVVHKNRWLIWAIAYVIMVAIVVVGYIKIAQVNDDNQLQAQNIFTAWHSYTDNRLGFALRYPANWSIEADSKSSIDFLPQDTTQEGITVGVYTPATEKEILKSLNIVSQRPVMVDGATGTLISNDLGHQAIETIVMVVANNHLYYLAGPDKLIQEFLQTFRFINPTT